jgi:hypothetical protein
LLGLGVSITLAKLQKKDHLAEHLLELIVPMMFGAIIASRFGMFFHLIGVIIKITHGKSRRFGMAGFRSKAV